MRYEIQKACIIPVSVGAGWRGDSAFTTEVWQAIDSAGSKEEAQKKLEATLNFNKGRGFFYRIALVEPAIKA